MPTPSVPAAGPSATVPATEEIVGSLLARPLRLPRIAAGAPCPVSGATARSPVAQEADARGLGTGPLYPIAFYIGENATLQIGDQARGSNGLYELKVVWASTSGHPGPVLVRVGRVDGVGRAAIALFYEADSSRGDAAVFPLTASPSDFPSSTSVSGPGCYGYQIDGVNLEEVIVFRVVR
jgi:hypothetical protein